MKCEKKNDPIKCEMFSPNKDERNCLRSQFASLQEMMIVYNDEDYVSIMRQPYNYVIEIFVRFSLGLGFGEWKRAWWFRVVCWCNSAPAFDGEFLLLELISVKWAVICLNILPCNASLATRGWIEDRQFWQLFFMRIFCFCLLTNRNLRHPFFAQMFVFISLLPLSAKASANGEIMERINADGIWTERITSIVWLN